MSEVFAMDPSRPDLAAAAVGAAAESLSAGHLVIMPTETVYGIAARADLPDATSRLFQAKRRPGDLTLPVLAAGTEAAWGLARPTEAACRLAHRFWPGPLTLVLPRTELTLGWTLGHQARSIGVRVPDLPLCAHLIARCGPLASTSANLSGRPPLDEPQALVASFGEAVATYLVVIPGRPAPRGRPSTVLDLTGAEPRVLRPGAIEFGRLAAVIGQPSSPLNR